ncbi:citrate synthase/methylcitrate synthase [Pseudomonas capsici]|uniref:Citrate synthase n=1 Tax=Pseudomonas capsici TaxID=2810614 RepID=A0ABT3BTD6_9PSED|nr:MULTISPECIES: citrate synthase/methylcitrate synthase [Pseudomonas]MCV4266775.1 citrate synthase/methylcitrate synthase [Pseudomonas capsici]MCV4277634.1 citrate synthase/methylcitrate synthase [Pseudomonas capsici]MCV4331185.1 citrate synthase/methylcitrate synthase [Pseudomonas capsici]MCV4376117.1 citrate synthase/methylcitrate synthase [Pseudomonas capsici]GFM52125.1 citrate synthase/methylcitrate synthase [Pseudomonas cichorii]
MNDEGKKMAMGLDDVVAAETRLSLVDGDKGILIIRGKLLDSISSSFDYEEILTSLWEGLFNRTFDTRQVRESLGKARLEVFEELSLLDQHLIKKLPPVEAMRSLISRFIDGNDFDTAVRLVAAPAVYTSALVRARQGRPLIKPKADITHAEDILRMAGLDSSPLHTRALNTYLVTIIDHGLNASTFAGRVVASTKAGLVSSVLAAVSALKGPLHGGAPGPVLDMLDSIGGAENAQSWLESTVTKGERLMGFGHRIYKVRDPRADALKQALESLHDSTSVDKNRLELAAHVEKTALAVLKKHKPNKPIHTNVEFYTALLLDVLGFDRADFTSVFTIGRVGGWLAHAREQEIHGRLIRPQSVYIGPQPS